MHLELSSYLALIIICLYIFAYALSSGPIIYIYAADILPDVGVGIVMAIMWVLYILNAYLLPIARKKFGMVAWFMFFVIVSFIGLLF